MWIDQITLPYLLIAVVSGMALFGIGDVAAALSRSKDDTARCIALMLWGTCVEITMATVALFLEHQTFAWAALRVSGRLIELIMVMRFLAHLRSEKT